MKIPFQVQKIYRVQGKSKIRAFVDIVLGGLVIRGLRIVEGRKGLFLGMPRRQGKDGRWYNSIYPINPQVYKQLNDLVLEAYQK